MKKMVNILCIGQYNRTGRFTAGQWKCFIKWCEIMCNEIIIYTRMTYETVISKFALYSNVNILEKPDKLLDVQAYEIEIIDVKFWTYIEAFNFDIDAVDDISHIYFFNHKKIIASLEIVDYENYILIETSVSFKDRLTLSPQMALENIQVCNNNKADIDDMTQNENWSILGIGRCFK